MGSLGTIRYCETGSDGILGIIPFLSRLFPIELKVARLKNLVGIVASGPSSQICPGSISENEYKGDETRDNGSISSKCIKECNFFSPNFNYLRVLSSYVFGGYQCFGHA